MIRREPCACGGTILADDDSPQGITVSVQLHNRSPQHTAWRLGMRLETVGGVRHRGVRTTRLVDRESAA